MKTLYRLGEAVYEQVGDRLLLKAKSAPSPGQLSMFDEAAHPRDGSGKFSSGSGGGSSTLKPRGASSKSDAAKESDGKIGEQEFARSLVNKERSYAHTRLSKEEAEYEGLDHKHPGSHWDDGEESFFAQMMSAYRDNSDEGVGKAFIESLDFTDETGWSSGNAMIRNSMSSVGWDSLHDLAQKLSSGTAGVDLSGENPATQILADYLESVFEAGREEEEEEGIDFGASMAKPLESPESLRKWIVKQGVTRLDRDESGTALELARSELNSFDAKTLGQAIAKELKIPQALEREKETGYKNGVIKPWEQSESGLDSKAWKSFKEKVNWSAVKMIAAKLAENPDHDWKAPLLPSGRDQGWADKPAARPTAVAIESLQKLLKQDGAEKLKADIQKYDPAHIARFALERGMKELPEIRKVGEEDA